ncbi:MAG: sugar transferase [Pseudomonadota bacterium]|nr:sugar transferase [Pseudomonadota bacterium]
MVAVLPMAVLPGWSLWPAQFTLIHWTSCAVVALSFVLVAVGLRVFGGFPGERSVLAAIPLLLGWYGALVVLVLVLRLPYSIAYIATGFTLSIAWFVAWSMYVQNVYKLKFAFVPLGRAVQADQLQGVDWVRLDVPAPEGVGAADGIVADLHSPELSDQWQAFLAWCSLQHLPVYNIRQVEESLTGRVKIRHMYENDLGSLLPSHIYMAVKYVFESLLIIVSLPLTLPLMLLTALLIKLDDGGKVFFNQERVGYRGEPFLMYKFRSMTESGLNQQQTTAHGDTRVTRVGRTIRKLRIDELPQFLNVIKGEMSLIGPRAEYKKFADELEQQVPFYQYRHIVKPGISGWAQVMHGYATGAEETQVKIEHDFYYIKHFSFWLDLLIIFKTIRTMLTGFGAR